MSENEAVANPKKYAMYRANVARRRTTYKAFIWIVIAVFLISVVDIMFLDSILYWGVLAAYAILFVWAIIMLIAFKINDAWKVGEVILHCPHCDHSFLYAADHADNEAHSRMTCPICSTVSDLPISDDEVSTVHLGTGKREEHAYRCDSCNEHFVITTLGEAQRRVKFDHCPHCSERGTVEPTELPDKVTRMSLKHWTRA